MVPEKGVLAVAEGGFDRLSAVQDRASAEPVVQDVEEVVRMREIHLIVRRPLEIQRDERGFVGIGAEQDMEGEQTRFRSRKAFDYSVQTPDGTRELGCVYVTPSPVPGYDAVVRLWVTQA